MMINNFQLFVTVTEQQTDVTDAKKSHKTPQSLITESHVKGALAADKGSEADLISWSVVNFTKKGDNYACTVTSICVDYRQGGSEKKIIYVAKCNPCRSIPLLNYFTTMVFEKEAGFYQELMPRLNAELSRTGQDTLRLPSCFFTHLVKGEEVIILRDLRDEGFKMFDRIKGMDKTHAMLVLKELGRLHAASILFQATTSESLNDTYKFLGKDFTYFTQKNNSKTSNLFEFHLHNAALMAEKIGGYETVVSWLRELAGRVNDVFEEQVKYTPPFDVICHGDCWNNNVLFRLEGTSVQRLTLYMSIL